MRIAFIVALLLLTGCATAPRQIQNACAIFEQRDGLFNNWQRAANHAAREYGVPVPILMATIYTESGFRPNARPPRTKLFGFIPWKRQSTAYGFSQALNGTWSEYKLSTGHLLARRTKFSDAIHFVAWYHSRNAKKLGIAKTDAYNLYLAYYLGDGGYRKGAYRGNTKLQGAARRSTNIANNYAKQLRSCD